MIARHSFSLVAFAIVFSLTGLAQAQRRPRHRPHHPAAMATPTPWQDDEDEDADEDDADEDDADEDTSPTADVTAVPSVEGGTTYGVFVGITHYRGENEDLPGTADDARNLAQSFERAGWMQRHNAVVLTDESATADRVRQAFSALAPRVGPRDMFVFFFDGHGDADEIDLRGRDLTRRDLSRMLDGVRGRSLVVLDSCNSGGFASVVRGHPTRAGLFSSRANESSSVAEEVGSGGWLAWHFRRAVDGGVRRRADGSIDFDEVSRYVQAQYRRSHVEGQHLVAVRGGTREDFAIGGAGTGVEPSEPTDVMVARNDRGTPEPMPADDGWTNGNVPQGFPVNDGFDQAVRLGVGLATATLQAITK